MERNKLLITLYHGQEILVQMLLGCKTVLVQTMENQSHIGGFLMSPANRTMQTVQFHVILQVFFWSPHTSILFAVHFGFATTDVLMHHGLWPVWASLQDSFSRSKKKMTMKNTLHYRKVAKVGNRIVLICKAMCIHCVFIWSECN